MVDYKGQQLCENINNYVIIIASIVAWIVGYVHQDFMLALYGWAGGCALTLLLCIPDWPYFNRNPVKWLDKIGQHKAGVANTGTKIKSTKKEK